MYLSASIHSSVHIIWGVSFFNGVNNRCNQMEFDVRCCAQCHMEWCLLWTCVYATKLPQTKQDVSIKFVIGLYFLRLHTSFRKTMPTCVIKLFLSMTQYHKYCILHYAFWNIKHIDMLCSYMLQATSHFISGALYCSTVRWRKFKNKINF